MGLGPFLSISPTRREHRPPPGYASPCPFVATCFVERSPRCIESRRFGFHLGRQHVHTTAEGPLRHAALSILRSFRDADGRPLVVVILRQLKRTTFTSYRQQEIDSES